MGGQLKKSIISSSLQILRLIVAAEKRSSKTVWTLIGLVCLVVFSVMFANSVMFFLKYPIQEGPLEFPAVSVCSLNPYKSSSLKSKAPQLYEAISNYSRTYLENEAAGRIPRDIGQQQQPQDPDEVVHQRKRRAAVSTDTMTNKGQAFYLTFFPDASSQPTNPSILLATTLPFEFPVTITNKGGGYTTTNITIDNSQVYEVKINTKKVNWKTGFKLTADYEFAAYTMQWRYNLQYLSLVTSTHASADATLLLVTLGTDYMNIGYSGVTDPSYLYIVGTADGTDITVTSPSGVDKSYTADEMDVVKLSAKIDYSGYRVQSSAPIAVFTAVDCLSYPYDCGGCDQVFEQLPPIVSMGSEYALVPFQHVPATISTKTGCASSAVYDARTYELFKVVAIFDGTTVSRTGTITSDADFNLDAGQAKEILARPNEYSYLNASQPVVVVQVMQAHNYVKDEGDASLLIIPPIEDYSNNFFIISCHSRFTSHYFTVVLDPALATGLLLNGSPFLGSITANPIPYTNLSAYHYPVDCRYGDSFNITHPDPFAAYSVVAYGRAEVISYAYNAGRLFHKEERTTTSSTTTTSTQTTTTGTTTTDTSTVETTTASTSTASTTVATTEYGTSTLASTTFASTIEPSTTAELTTIVTSSATSPNATTVAETSTELSSTAVAETTSIDSTGVSTTGTSTSTGTSAGSTSAAVTTLRTTAEGDTTVLTITAGTTDISTTSTAEEMPTVVSSKSTSVTLANATSPTTVEATTTSNADITSPVTRSSPTSSSEIESNSASTEISSSTTSSAPSSTNMLISTLIATSTVSLTGYESTSSLASSSSMESTIGSSATTSSGPSSTTTALQSSISSTSSTEEVATNTTSAASSTSSASSVPTSVPSSTSTGTSSKSSSSNTSIGETSSLESTLTTEKSTSTSSPDVTTAIVPSSTLTQPPSPTTSSQTSAETTETSTQFTSSTRPSLETSFSSSIVPSSTSASSPASSEGSSQASSATLLPAPTQALTSTSSTPPSSSDSSTKTLVSTSRTTEASTSVPEDPSTSSSAISSIASSSGGTMSTVVATSMHASTSTESASEPVPQSTMVEEYSTSYIDSSAITSEHISPSEESVTTVASAGFSEVLSTTTATSSTTQVVTTIFDNSPTTAQSSVAPGSHEPSDPPSTETITSGQPNSTDFATTPGQSQGPSTSTSTVSDSTTAATTTSSSTIESTSIETQTPLTSDSIGTAQATSTGAVQPASSSLTLIALTTDELSTISNSEIIAPSSSQATDTETHESSFAPVVTVALEASQTTTVKPNTIAALTTTVPESIPTSIMTSSSTSDPTTTAAPIQKTVPTSSRSSIATVSSSSMTTEAEERYSATSPGRFKIKKTDPTVGPPDPHDDSHSTLTASQITTGETSTTTTVSSSISPTEAVENYSTTSNVRFKIKKTDPTVGPQDPHDDPLSTSIASQLTTLESSTTTTSSSMSQTDTLESHSTTSRGKMKVKKTDPTVGPADPHEDSLSTSTAYQPTTDEISSTAASRSTSHTEVAERYSAVSPVRIKVKKTDPTVGPPDPHEDSLLTTTVQEFRTETTSAMASSDSGENSSVATLVQGIDVEEFTTTHLSTETSVSSKATSSTTLVTEASKSMGSITQASSTFGQTPTFTTLHPDQPASTTATVEDHYSTSRGRIKVKKTDPTVGPPDLHDDPLETTSTDHSTDHVSTSMSLDQDTSSTSSEDTTTIAAVPTSTVDPALSSSATTSTASTTLEVTSLASPKRRRIPITDPTPMPTDPHDDPLPTTATLIRPQPEHTEEISSTSVQSASSQSTSSAESVSSDWASPLGSHGDHTLSTTTLLQWHEDIGRTTQLTTVATMETAISSETTIPNETTVLSTRQATEAQLVPTATLLADLRTSPLPRRRTPTAAPAFYTTTESISDPSGQTAAFTVSSLKFREAAPDTLSPSPPSIQAAAATLHKRPVTKPDASLTLPPLVPNAEPTAIVAADSPTAPSRNMPSAQPQVPHIPTQTEQSFAAAFSATEPDAEIPSVQDRTVIDAPAPPIAESVAAPAAIGDVDFPKPKELTGLLPWASEMEDSLAYFVNMYGIDPSLLGYDLDEFIFWCRYDGRKCNFSTEISTFVDPSYGNCFTFNPKASTHYSQRGGQRLGLRIIFHTPSSEYLPFILPSGYKVVLHEPDEAPMMSISGVTCSPGQYYSFSMFKIDNKRMEEPYQQCDNNLTTANPAYYTNKSYSIETCMGSCYQRMMIDKCGCGDPHYPLPPGGLHCNITQKPCIDKAATESISMSGCSCQPACKSTTFTFSQSKSIWPSYQWTPPTCELDANPAQCLKQFKSSYSRVDVFYGSMTGIKMEAYAQYTLMQLISDTFANSGLWLAICAISIFEMVLLPIVQRG